MSAEFVSQSEAAPTAAATTAARSAGSKRWHAQPMTCYGDGHCRGARSLWRGEVMVEG